MKNFKIILILFSFLFASCSQGLEDESMEKAVPQKNLSKDVLSSKNMYESGPKPEAFIHDVMISRAIDETAPCDYTQLGYNFNQAYIDIFVNDPYELISKDGITFSAIYFIWDINYWHSLFDESPQYYGKNGEYTNYVNNRIRSLQKFYPMEDEIQVKGQHAATLNDKEAILFAIESTLPDFAFGFPQFIYDSPEEWADILIENNKLSEVLPESPLTSSDGFAWTLGGGLSGIVIGDGLIELVASVGTEEKIGWTTVLSHEWAHQVQYQYDYIEYWQGQFNNAPEITRAIELEADFVSSYYMTHKRGATYNMKRIEQYLRNFFEIGDCSFTSSGHHGTPRQRMEASYSGNELAKSAQKKGKILSPEEIHMAFVEVLDDIAPQP